MNTEPVDYIERTREQYATLGYPPYQWVENDLPPPFRPLSNFHKRPPFNLQQSHNWLRH